MALLPLYLILPVFQLWVFVNAQPFAEGWDLVDYGASIFAFHWLLSNVILSSKIPILQTLLPYDKRIQYHLLGTLGIIVSVAFHAGYKILIGKEITWISWTLLGLLGALVILGLFWIPLPVIKHIRALAIRAVHKVFHLTYDLAKKFHELIFLGLAGLLYFHLSEADLFTSVPEWSGWLYIGLLILALGVFLVSKVKGFFYPWLRVNSVELKGSMIELSLDSDPRFKYRSGQFTFLKFHKRDLRGETHPFSFLSAPGEGNIRFGIRPLGDFTRKLLDLSPGNLVKINGAYGGFHPRKTKKSLCFVGSGVGIVPIVSIIKDLADQKDTRPLQAFLSVDKTTETLDREILEHLSKANPNWKITWLVYEKDDIKYSPEFFQAHLKSPQDHTYFLCSSPLVRSIVTQSLTFLGVKPHRLHYEAFSLG